MIGRVILPILGTWGCRTIHLNIFCFSVLMLPILSYQCLIFLSNIICGFFCLPLFIHYHFLLTSFPNIYLCLLCPLSFLLLFLLPLLCLFLSPLLSFLHSFLTHLVLPPFLPVWCHSSLFLLFSVVFKLRKEASICHFVVGRSVCRIFLSWPGSVCTT